MSSIEPQAGPLSLADQDALHTVARTAIREGLAGRAMVVRLEEYRAALSQPRGCFVTLRQDEALRGCLGSLQAAGPLVSEVARLALAAATRDPRFAPVDGGEVAGLTIKISVLSPAETMAVSSEHELLEQLRPRVDGLILSDGAMVGTFLPEVWDSFGSAREFVEQLRSKAGMPPGHWSSSVVAQRYTTQSF